jgi:hypothetical protein
VTIPDTPGFNSFDSRSDDNLITRSQIPNNRPFTNILSKVITKTQKTSTTINENLFNPAIHQPQTVQLRKVRGKTDRFECRAIITGRFTQILKLTFLFECNNGKILAFGETIARDDFNRRRWANPLQLPTFRKGTLLARSRSEVSRGSDLGLSLRTECPHPNQSYS